MNYIYCITNIINNKRYVGKTTQTLEERFKEHCRDSFRERCNKRPLYDAMNKYGIENFIIEELEQVEDETKLDEREIYWIQELQTYGSNGYNATKGGDGKILYNYKEIIDLYNLGYDCKQVASKIGCNESTIRKVLKANNIKIRRGGTKRIDQFDLAGNYIQYFFGATECINWLKDHSDYKLSGNSKSHITDCCNNKIKTAYGYIWKYSILVQ